MPNNAEQNIARSYAILYLGVPLFLFGSGCLLSLGKMYYIPHLFKLTLLQSSLGVAGVATAGVLLNKKYGLQTLGVSVICIPIGLGYFACSMIGLNAFSGLLTAASFAGVGLSFVI